MTIPGGLYHGEPGGIRSSTQGSSPSSSSPFLRFRAISSAIGQRPYRMRFMLYDSVWSHRTSDRASQASCGQKMQLSFSLKSMLKLPRDFGEFEACKRNKFSVAQQRPVRDQEASRLDRGTTVVPSRIGLAGKGI
jgi:hypothetical protein